MKENVFNGCYLAFLLEKERIIWNIFIMSYLLVVTVHCPVDLVSKSIFCRAGKTAIHTSDLISVIEWPFFLSDDNFWLQANIVLLCQSLFHISTEWPVSVWFPL